AVKDVSFKVREGQIFGLGGLIGSGRTELARLMFGLDRRNSGKIIYKGKDVTPDSPMQAIKNGFGYLTEDRKETGLVMRRPVKENITIAEMTMKKPVFLNLPKERRAASKMVSVLKIVTPSLEQVVMNLSGGNQQKVVLAKWMLSNVDIIIFDEPTIGIDVGSKKEIYELMNEMSENGVARDIFLEETILPMHKLFRTNIKKAHPQLPDEKVTLCISSIFGQIFHFVRARAVIRRTVGREYDSAFIKDLIDHITDFSVRGIRG
ncbi:hypothetical protein LCGC14_1680190, partial [marine sediment metagenome]